MAHLQFLDDLIKEYLVFRGFTSTLRSFENDLKNDKDKGFRVDRITNQIQSYIQTYDLNGLLDIWGHLDQRVFGKLAPPMLLYVKRFETSLLRLYLINTIQTNKSDKMHEFFDTLAPELQKNSDWKEWFVLPYLKGPEDTATFAMYFTKQWQDTLFVSLQNFLAIVFQNLKLPVLASYTSTSEKIASLQDENELMRVRLKALSVNLPQDKNTQDTFAPKPILDDFYDIKNSSVGDLQTKPVKGFLKRSGENLPSLQTKSQGTLPIDTGHIRISSRTSIGDKNRKRSSSLAPTGSGPIRGNDQTKAIDLGATEGTSSRSPTSTCTLSPDLKDKDGSTRPSPFLIIARESYPDHRSIVGHAVFNQAGTVIASGDSDGVVKLWSPYPSPKTEGSIVMKGMVTSIEWLSRTETYLLIASKSGTLKLYDTQEKKTVWDIVPETCLSLKDQKIMCMKAPPSETSLIASVAPKSKISSSSKALRPGLLVFDFKSQKLEKCINFEDSIVNTCVTNHNGGLLICGCNDGLIRIVDLRSFEAVESWAAHQGEVFCVKLSPQEDKIYSLGSDNKFISWSLAKTGSRVLEQRLHEGAVGPFLVGVGEGRSLWEQQGGRSVFLRPYGSLFAIHQNNQFLFTCSPTGPVIYKMEPTLLQEVMHLRGHTSPIITLDWSSALQCGSCVSSSLDSRVSLTTLMPQ